MVHILMKRFIYYMIFTAYSYITVLWAHFPSATESYKSYLVLKWQFDMANIIIAVNIVVMQVISAKLLKVLYNRKCIKI